MATNSECTATERTELKPKNVPSHLWEKFKALEKRTNETTKRSTEKRIKHLQKTALESVSRALSAGDKAIVQLPPEVGNDDSDKPTAASLSRKRPHNDGKSDQPTFQESSSGEEMKKKAGVEEEWQRVRGFIGINDHLTTVSHGSLGPKTLLQVKMEAAIAEGDFQTAEELSDHMATREFGEKVAQAIDAKNFLESKLKEEETMKTRHQKKLHWGFEAKHRWETKGNM